MSKSKMLPKKLSDAEMVFGPARIADMMPSYAELRTMNVDPSWERFISRWFFKGIGKEELSRLKPRDGVDGSAALRHVGSIMRSFEPKHEHKTRGCAYLMQSWFEGDAP